MLKNVKLQFLLVAGVSALLGYAAAYRQAEPVPKADGGTAGTTEGGRRRRLGGPGRAGLLLGRPEQGRAGRPGRTQ